MNGAKVINTILERESIKAATFARKIGITPTQIYDLQKGKVKNVSSDIADKIISVYPLYNKAWIMTGISSPIIENAPESGKESNIIKITLPDMSKPELGANKHGMNLVTGMSEKLKALGYDTPKDDKGYKALVAKLADKLVDMRTQPTAQSVSEEMIGMITKPLLDRLGMVEKQKIELELRAAQLETKLAEYERRKAE